MVKVTIDDLKDDEKHLLDSISDDSDEELTSEKYENKMLGKNVLSKDKDLSNILMIWGNPITDKEKVSKFETFFIKKATDAWPAGLTPIDFESVKFEWPIDPQTNSTTGVAFLHFADNDASMFALSVFDRHKLIAGCNLNACIITSYDDYIKPVKTKKLDGDRAGLYWWLNPEISNGSAQFAVRAMKKTEVYWHDAIGCEPILIDDGSENRREGKKSWTTGRIDWSTRGKYFLTYHMRGIRLWGGINFTTMARVPTHTSKPSHISFSPNERYLMVMVEGKDNSVIYVWETTSERLIRCFAVPQINPRGLNEWPYFLWSHDSSYLASIAPKNPGNILIYKCDDSNKSEKPRLDLCQTLSYDLGSTDTKRDAKHKDDEHPVKAKKAEPERFLGFDWSPASSILSVYVPEKDDKSSRVVLIDIPSNRDIATKNLYNVRSTTMHWQSKGLYMALVMSMIIKASRNRKAKIDFIQIEIFRLKEKDIPIDTIRIDDHSTCQFFWEKNGHRMAVLVGTEIRFYGVGRGNTAAKRETTLLTSYDLKSTQYNFFAWSPIGTYFIVVAMSAEEGAKEDHLIFGALTEQNKVDVIRKDVHDPKLSCNSVTWESTGRYVCTAIVSHPSSSSLDRPSQPYRQKGFGFKIWNFQGRLQVSKQFHSSGPSKEEDKCYMFMWRPQPSILPPEKERDVFKNLKKYNKAFDKKDLKLREEKEQQMSNKRMMSEEDFVGKVRRMNEWYSLQKEYKKWKEAERKFEQSFQYETETITKTVLVEQNAAALKFIAT